MHAVFVFLELACFYLTPCQLFYQPINVLWARMLALVAFVCGAQIDDKQQAEEKEANRKGC